MTILSSSTVVLLGLILTISGNKTLSRVRRIIGGEPANYPPYDDPVVYVRFNGKSARVVGVREFPHYVFKGIKYAHPPVGADRFLRPREKNLAGHVRASVFSEPCIQPVPGKNKIIGSEDCLALNIFTPDLPTGTEGLPVIIWIHGGGFRYGSASQYGVRHLVSQRLVVVTIQYRLGSLGFLSSGSKHLPGNAGLWDMALAVKWVRNYIGFFGGNPHRIVVMGHNTGASSALLLSLTKIAKGSPYAVVAMSGTAVSQWATGNNPSNTARQIAEENNCPTVNSVTMIKCLQKVPAESIIKDDSQIEFQRIQTEGFISGLNGRLATAPVTEGLNDGRSLPGFVEVDPVEALYKQENRKIPLLTGVTKDETKRAVKGQFRKDILQQLNSIPDFVNQVLIQRLQKGPLISRLSGKLDNIHKIGSNAHSLTDNIEAILGSLDDAIPINFKNYLKTEANDTTGNLDKIADVTADALFNVPAFLTAQFWKGAPAFLYSFEHSGNLNRGFSFLQGLPLIGNDSTDAASNSVGHGDELAYLFDAQDLQGNPLPEGEPTDDDLKVRNTFTKMIADFARHGAISVEDKKLPAFNSGENNFIQIKPKPALANNFKYCEMALWSKIGERLKSTYCQFLKAFEGESSGLGQNNLKSSLLSHSNKNNNKSVLAIIGNSQRAKVRNDIGSILG